MPCAGCSLACGLLTFWLAEASIFAGAEFVTGLTVGDDVGADTIGAGLEVCCCEAADDGG